MTKVRVMVRVALDVDTDAWNADYGTDLPAWEVVQLVESDAVAAVTECFRGAPPAVVVVPS